MAGITKPMKVLYQNSKLAKLYMKLKIREVNGYNMFGE